MNSRLLHRNLTSGENNIGDLPTKMIQVSNTPRKIPFKDATNQSSAFKTPGKGLKNEINKTKDIQQISAPKIEIHEDFSCDTRPLKGCYCGGAKDKKTDMEALMDNLVTPEFLKLLEYIPQPIDDFEISYESFHEELPTIKRMQTPPPSPVKFTEELQLPDLEFDDDMNVIFKPINDSGFSHTDTASVLDESDEIIIPEMDFDYNFSLDDLKISDDQNSDDSMIMQW